MPPRPRPRLQTLVALLAAISLGPTATADESAEDSPKFLITLEGERIELGGPIEEKGSRVVFQDGDGRLRSLPRSAVDFEAMRRPTAEPPPTPDRVETTRAPVLVLTDNDVARYRRPAARPAATPEAPIRQRTTTGSSRSGDEESAPAPEDGSQAPDASPQEPQSSVEVIHWDDQGSEEEDEPGTDIWGAIENTGTIPVDAILVEVRLVSADGTLLANQKVEASAGSLLSGAKANFNATFGQAIRYDDVEFVVSYEELRR